MEKSYQKEQDIFVPAVKKLIDKISAISALDYLWLSLIIITTSVLFLGGHPLLVPDEARYSEVAHEMLMNHQFITPQINGIDFFDKPILFYWLQASSMAIFGVNAWAIRLWPMLFGLFGVLIVYSTTKQLFNRQTAWITALVLATCPLYYFTAHYANLDLEVAVLITASLCFFIRAYQPAVKSLNAKWLYASYAAAGLAILTKGLIGLAFPIMVIGLWILFTNQWFLVRQMRILTGLGLIVLITLPWFIVVEYYNPGFSYYFFYIQQFLRFLTANFNNIEPFWFYIPVVLVGMLPWTPFLYQAIKQYIKNKNVISTFLIIWALAIFIFFSIPHSKLIGYIIPVIPPLAMLAGQAYITASNKLKRSIVITYLIAFVLATLAIWVLPANMRDKIGITIEMQLIFSMVSILLMVMLGYVLRVKSQLLFASLVITNFVIYNLILASFLLISPAAMGHYFPIKTLMTQIKPIINPSDKLVSYFEYYQDLPMYSGKQILIVHHWDTPGLAKKDSWRGEFAYSAQYLQPDAKKAFLSPEQFVQLWNSNQRLFVFLPKKKLAIFSQSIAPATACILGQEAKVILATNDKKLCDK
jgi:4-amino-4-deoxy-L-arabinose transferase-like glycosyltransferase